MSMKRDRIEGKKNQDSEKRSTYKKSKVAKLPIWPAVLFAVKRINIVQKIANKTSSSFRGSKNRLCL
jgi:hypothetical protein